MLAVGLDCSWHGRLTGGSMVDLEGQEATEGVFHRLYKRCILLDCASIRGETRFVWKILDHKVFFKAFLCICVCVHLSVYMYILYDRYIVQDSIIRIHMYIYAHMIACWAIEFLGLGVYSLSGLCGLLVHWPRMFAFADLLSWL